MKIKEGLREHRECILNVLYSVILVLMLLQTFRAETWTERVLFMIPAVCCVFAIFGGKGSDSFEKVQQLIYRDCQPELARSLLVKEDSPMRKGKHRSGAKLLYAYSLMDTGRWEECREFLTEKEKDLFMKPEMAVKTKYLLFQNSYLKGDLEECQRLFQALSDDRSAFETGENGSLSPAWRMLQGDLAILSGDYEKAAKAYGAFDPSGLGTNREKAYYHCGMSRIHKGMDDPDRANAELAQACQYGREIHMIQNCNC